MTTLPEPDRSSETPGGNRARSPTGQAVRFLVIGRILGPVGVAGEMRVQALTDFPERFERLSVVHVGDNLRPYNVKAVRIESGENVLLTLEGVDTADAARAMRNDELSVPIDQAVPLEADRYYWHEIIGLEVWTDTGEDLGKVQQVLRTGSNDVYVVGTGAREILIPAIEDVVKSIDVPAGKITVHLIPGLIDEIPEG
ncbi:MAG TPA: ribosome maturation factor RimM [Chloroflexota bacterium]|nr:ribosome maturation factor RimM [Chloroflexota bacterium]